MTDSAVGSDWAHSRQSVGIPQKCNMPSHAICDSGRLHSLRQSGFNCWYLTDGEPLNLHKCVPSLHEPLAAWFTCKLLSRIATKKKKLHSNRKIAYYVWNANSWITAFKTWFAKKRNLITSGIGNNLCWMSQDLWDRSTSKHALIYQITIAIMLLVSSSMVLWKITCICSCHKYFY